MSLKVNNQQDEDLISRLSAEELDNFLKWFKELNRINAERDNTFYSGTRLENSTGISCWFDYFAEGFEPNEALDEDVSNA